MFGRLTKQKKGLKAQPVSPMGGQAPYTHTLGSIIWMALLRLGVTLFVAWYLKDHFNVYSEWWLVTGLAIYGIAIYPAQIQYEYFKRNNRELIEDTLCSSCRHYRPENLHCTLLDEHVSEHYLPCEGEEWEPKNLDVNIEG
ncbi:MAG: hypothetical protein KDD67_06850 [Ignavibacteriae bacterium]|nr:hypothetical protein [Ignavibacteriota bacterium]MCB9215656.1 hypothetical protein [Ignavibacteria bacterium]